MEGHAGAGPVGGSGTRVGSIVGCTVNPDELQHFWLDSDFCGRERLVRPARLRSLARSWSHNQTGNVDTDRTYSHILAPGSNLSAHALFDSLQVRP